MNQNTTEEITTGTNNETNRFFAVGGFISDEYSKISIFDKNDVSKPYKVVSLPTPTEGSGRYILNGSMQEESPIFFESTGMYILGSFDDLNDQEINPLENSAILFYMTIDGTISKVATIDTLSHGNPSIAIDQKNKKIYRIDSTATGKNMYQCTVSMYDIINGTYSSFTKDSLSSGQQMACENSSEWFSLISLKDGLVNVVFDVMEVDIQTPTAEMLTIDMAQNQIVSEVPFTQWKQEQTNRISFTWDCMMMDPTTCTVLIDNAPVSTPKDVYIKTFVNDTTLFGTTDTGYIFMPLESLQIK